MPNDDNVNSPHVLLVNPWIHDFAAYDYWAKPMGLLMLAAILRQHGIRVSYIDCLDRFHPRDKKTNPLSRQGRGPYLKTPLRNPVGLENVPRRFSRYGIPKEWFLDDANSLSSPDLIFVTSLMTYWYPGVFETISCLKQIFPGIPVVLGGIYATLCETHAVKNAGADRVVSGSGVHRVLTLVEEYTGFKTANRFDPDDLNTYPFPAFDLQHKIPYIPLLTSMGCPFHCAYCASKILNPVHRRRKPENIANEIGFWYHHHGVKDFAFYDDALLINAEKHAIPLLETIIDSNITARFHTPNALHASEISGRLAGLIFQAGFKTIRLGLETGLFINRAKHLDQKMTRNDFDRSVLNLKKAGFEKHQIGAYLLVGLPGESRAELEASIQMVKSAGITPVLAHYTPIPMTSMWNRAVRSSRYDLEADPIFTNNAVSPCTKDPFSWQKLSHLKQLASD